MTTNYQTLHRSPNILVRILWYVVVGWWLSGVFIAAGYLCTATIILMPLGFWFLNRVPQVQTLRMVNTEFAVVNDGGYERIVERHIRQFPWIIRLVYLPFGLLFGAIWLAIAWVLGLAIVTLPLSILMIDRAPFIITLQRHA